MQDNHSRARQMAHTAHLMKRDQAESQTAQNPGYQEQLELGGPFGRRGPPSSLHMVEREEG